MRSIAVGLLLASAAASTAFAESGTTRLDQGDIGIVGEEADLSPSVVENSLFHSGYSQIKFLSHSEFSVSAFDREGSEVILHLNPQTGDVVGSR